MSTPNLQNVPDLVAPEDLNLLEEQSAGGCCGGGACTPSA